jgi:hypothetical protein
MHAGQVDALRRPHGPGWRRPNCRAGLRGCQPSSASDRATDRRPRLGTCRAAPGRVVSERPGGRPGLAVTPSQPGSEPPVGPADRICSVAVGATRPPRTWVPCDSADDSPCDSAPDNLKARLFPSPNRAVSPTGSHRGGGCRSLGRFCTDEHAVAMHYSQCRFFRMRWIFQTLRIYVLHS